MRTLSLLFTSIIFITSCNSKVDENKQLQDEVIAIHDEIMPLMGEFVRNSIKIDSLLEYSHHLDQKQDNHTERKEELTDLKKTLDDANEAMNDWMHEFELEHDDKSNTEVKEYLENELKRINSVKTKFSEASQKSAVLKNY